MLQGYRMTFPPETPEEAADFIRNKIWAENAKDRSGLRVGVAGRRTISLLAMDRFMNLRAKMDNEKRGSSSKTKKTAATSTRKTPS